MMVITQSISILDLFWLRQRQLWMILMSETQCRDETKDFVPRKNLLKI